MDEVRALVSWVGETDLRAAEGVAEVGLGPLGQAVTQRAFDRVLLLSNYERARTRRFVHWLGGRTEAAIAVHQVRLSSPMHFGEIYEAATARITGLRDEHGERLRLTFHISPGTSAMAAVWIILAKTRFAAELIQSSKEHGVQTAEVPFDISAEFVPALMEGPDRALAALSAGGAPRPVAGFEAITHRSPQMARVVELARRVAPRSVPVLIEGESGTGKELFARAIHAASPRRDGPFVAVNCGAIPADLAESELFGHRKGAFTGADRERKGYFEEASGGTLLLDELGELPLALQVKLLRVLEQRAVTRIGTSGPRPVDVRLIAATHRSLASEVAAGRFREDLFYRVAVAVIRLPPLRSRAGDLGLLIDALLARVNDEWASDPGWQRKRLSAGARNVLLRHSWPGNVRELLNTLMRACVWSEGPTISAETVREALLLAAPGGAGRDPVLGRPLGDGFDIQAVIREVAGHYLRRALDEAGGNRTRAARLVGLRSYQTFKNWMERYGVEA